jgi:delta8-fatty-acid desaturase
MASSDDPPRLPLLSRAEISALVRAGRHIIIVDGAAIRCDAWMPYHPGGDKAIKHMVGRDATDEVNACVPFLFAAQFSFGS